MSDHSHTPGPWEVVLDDDGESSQVAFVIRMGSHLDGANGWEPQHRIEYGVSAREESPTQFDEAEANANLIAAAPDLLSALARAEQAIHSEYCSGVCHPECIAVAAAIAKAEGRQSRRTPDEDV